MVHSNRPKWEFSVLVPLNLLRRPVDRLLPVCRRLAVFSLWIWIALASLTARAADSAATNQVEALLVAETAAVYPGAKLHFGVQQKIIPHWHTYWRNPGDSGTATTIDWELPAGSSASDILWPTPVRISMGPITNYGYENEEYQPEYNHFHVFVRLMLWSSKVLNLNKKQTK